MWKHMSVFIYQLPIRLYRSLFFLRYFFTSQHGGASCRFYPTCSKYALQAFKKHGILGGLYLTLIRVGKCHPFGQCYEEDQVPEEITIIKKKKK